MTQAELVGGPIDGRRINLTRGRPAFLWIDLLPKTKKQPRQGGCFLAPKKNRLLYRRVLNHYVYAGHTHALCTGCGAYSERVDGHVQDCSLCGSALAK